MAALVYSKKFTGGLPQNAFDPLDYQRRSTERRGDEEFRERAGALRLALPFFYRNDYDGCAASARDRLRFPGARPVDQLADLAFASATVQMSASIASVPN